MAFDVRNFIIDRPTRFLMLHSSTKEILWTIDQIENPSLSMSAESVDATDAIGNRIMTFDRAKNAEFKAESSLFSLGLAAAQFGTSKNTATVSKKIVVPKFDTITVPVSGTTVNLSKIPKGTAAAGLPYIYKMNGDSSMSTRFSYAAAASDNAFTYTGKVLTFPTSLQPGDRIFAVYEYEADGDTGNGAVGLTADATNFPNAGVGILEVLCKDVCDPSTLYFTYIVFPNAKLMSDVEIPFTTEGKHPFTIRANQDYCDPTKKLFSIAIPEVG